MNYNINTLHSPHMSQSLHHHVQIIRLIQIIQAHKSRQVPPPEQIPHELLPPIQPSLHLLSAERGMQRRRNVVQTRLVLDPIILRQTPVRPPFQVEVDEVSGVDAVSVGRGVLGSAAEEFAADEAGVDVRGGFEGDAAVGGEVEVERGAVDAV